MISRALLLFLLSMPMFASEEIQFSGDLRYRHDRIHESSNDVNQRDRIRFRLKAIGSPQKKINITARITSGTGSATSTNQTLGEGGKNKDIELDMAYATWTPQKRTKLFLGKMNNPLYRVGSSDILFDSDWTPEGLALSQSFKTDLNETHIYLSRFWIDEDSSTDVILHAPQIANVFKWGNFQTTLGLGYLNYSSLKGTGGFSEAGNTFKDNSFKNDYKLWQVFGEITFALENLKTHLFFETVENTEVSKNDRAYLVGSKFNFKKWSFSYDYRRVDADALVAFLADGDSMGNNGSNGQGNRYNLSRVLSKNTSISFVFYNHSFKDQSVQKHTDKYQINTVFKF